MLGTKITGNRYEKIVFRSWKTLWWPRTSLHSN